MAGMPPRTLVAAYDIWSLAWRVMLRRFMDVAGDRAVLSLVGQFDSLNRAHYDGAGLGKMYSNITGLSIGFGFNLGLATLCAQASGAGLAERDNPLLLRRAAVVLFFALIFSAGAALASQPLLEGAGMPSDVAATSAAFAQWSLTSLPFMWAVHALEKICDSLRQTRPSLYAVAAGTVVNVGASVVALHPGLLNWGYLGLAASRTLASATQLAVLVSLIASQHLESQVWRRGSTSRIQAVLDAKGIWAYLVVAVPGALLMWGEWWSFEGLAILTARLPNASLVLASHATLYNITVASNMVFAALSDATCAVVGRSIGAKRPRDVPWQCLGALVICVPLAFAVASALYFSSPWLARFFTRDPGVQHLIEATALGPAVTVAAFALLFTAFGVCRGANRQQQAAAQTLLFYVAGIGLAYYAGVVRGWPEPLLGIWLGNATAVGAAALAALLLVSCIRWEAVSRVVADPAPGASPPLWQQDRAQPMDQAFLQHSVQGDDGGSSESAQW
jgi:Na+-driven multidrug efflux pump